MKIQLYALIIISVIAISLILTGISSQMGVEYTEMGQGVASISVALGFLGVVLVSLYDPAMPRGTLIIAGGGAGAIFAYILERLYSQGVLIDEFVTGSITIADLMTITVILWVLIGIILEVTR